MIFTAAAVTSAFISFEFASFGIDVHVTVPGFASVDIFDFPAINAVEYPALPAISKIVGRRGYTGSLSGRSLFHSMPCLRGVTPVNMLVCDGSVIETAVVRAQNVYAPSRTIVRNVGMSASNARSGRNPSTLTIITCSTAGIGRVGFPIATPNCALNDDTRSKKTAKTETTFMRPTMKTLRRV
jgi:hypothetical protein